VFAVLCTHESGIKKYIYIYIYIYLISLVIFAGVLLSYQEEVNAADNSYVCLFMFSSDIFIYL